MGEEMRFHPEMTSALAARCVLGAVGWVLQVAFWPAWCLWMGSRQPGALHIYCEVTAFVFGLLGLATAIRAWRGGKWATPLALGEIVVGPEGIRAQGPWYRQGVRWDEVREVDVRTRPADGDVALGIEIHAGRSIYSIPGWFPDKDGLLSAILVRAGLGEGRAMPFGKRYERPALTEAKAAGTG